MAITKFVPLNPADKTRMYTYCMGEGVPAAGDMIVDNIHDYPEGSQYLDKAGKKLYCRVAETGAASDWADMGAGAGA